MCRKFNRTCFNTLLGSRVGLGCYQPLLSAALNLDLPCGVTAGLGWPGHSQGDKRPRRGQVGGSGLCVLKALLMHVHVCPPR